MRFRSVLAALTLVFLGAVPVDAQLPPKVAEMLDRAVTPIEVDEFTGRCTMTLVSVVQKPNGKSRKNMEFVSEVVNPGDGSQTRHLLRFIEDGKDVTEKQRQEFEDEEPAGEKKDDEEKDDTDFADPYGETAHFYRFGEAENADSEVVLSFEPAQEHLDNPEVARGRVAWNRETMAPTWMEMEAIHPPKPLKKLTMRFEFIPLGNDVFVARMVTDGLAKVLLMQREFHMDMRFDDIQPTAAESP